MAHALPRMSEAERDELDEVWWSPAYADAVELERLINSLCQGVWASGLMFGVEFDIWGMIAHPERWDDAGAHHPYCTEAQRQEMIAGVRKLTVDRGRWFVYDLPGNPWDARFVDLDEWERIRRGREA